MKNWQMGIPIPEFKVLLYGPSINPAGIKARARFEGNTLAVAAHKGFFLVQPHQITLRAGGYDGHQWLITWTAPEGTYSAMLQGDGALDAFIHLAPAEISQQLRQTRKGPARTGRRIIIGLAILALVALLAMGLFWINADRLSESAISNSSQEQEQ